MWTIIILVLLTIVLRLMGACLFLFLSRKRQGKKTVVALSDEKGLKSFADTGTKDLLCLQILKRKIEAKELERKSVCIEISDALSREDKPEDIKSLDNKFFRLTKEFEELKYFFKKEYKSKFF